MSSNHDIQAVFQHESARLAALAQYAIANTRPETKYDQLIKLALNILDMPIAGISFIGEKQLWIKSGIGIDICVVERSSSFCQYTLNQPEVLVINDALKESKYADLQCLAGDLPVRFYLGIPLITPEGFHIGSFYMMDTEPHTVNKETIDHLQVLAAQVMLHLENRRQKNLLAQQLAVQNQREYFKKQHNTLMENMAKGVAMLETFDAAIRLVEEQITDALCVVRLLDKTGTLLGKGYALNIPESYLEAVSGLQIDAVAAHASTTFTKKIVVTTDISADPLWQDYKDLALVHGLRACWWNPIFNQHNQLLGFFAVYSKQQHEPNPDEIAIVEEISHLLGIAIQREKMQKHLELLQTCIANQNDLLIITEAEALNQSEPNIVFVNEAFVRHTGFQFDEAVGKTAHILHGQLTDETAIKKIKAAMQAWQPTKVELISYKKNGEAFWQDLDLVPISDESGVFTHWILIGRDVSATKKAEDEIRHLAYYDALTALPNRRLLTDRLRQAMLANNRFVRHGALLYLDLDHFKNLNDTAGHAIGDMLLKQVAQRLARRTREDDTVARMGGDEFVVMLKDLDGQPAEAASQAKIVAEKILADFQKPFLINNQEFYSSPSIGITIFDDQKNPVEEILKRADLAMYQAKASGRNSLSFFESHMQENMTTRTQQEKNLRVALQKNELVLFYQPKINMNDEVVGVEALVRWQSPEKGLLPPSMFIDLAEETGLILPLGDWVLRKACEQLAIWATQPDYQHMSMSINVSVNQFNRPDFLVQVVNIIQETGTNPHKVILEITESIFAQNIEDIVRKMNALKTIGVRFALDDFGVAYSSLSHLRNLPLDEIKIDQSFVKNILHYSIDLAVAKSVIEIAKSLKIQAVAEGIETEAQRELLTAYGCYVHQGYLFAKPLPIAEFERYCLEVKKEASKRLSA